MSWLHLSGLVCRGNLRQGSVTPILFNHHLTICTAFLAIYQSSISWSVTTVWNFISLCIPFHMLARVWGALRLLSPHSASPWRRILPTNLIFPPSPTFSLRRSPALSFDVVSSIASCYLSCLSCLCHFLLQPRAPPASFPLPHWWEPTDYLAASRSLQATFGRTCLFLSRSWYRGHHYERKAPPTAFLLPLFHCNPLLYLKGE